MASDQFNSQTPVTKLSQTEPEPEEKTRKLQMIKAAQQLKDPEQAPTPALRLTATNAKLIRLTQDKRYQSLRDDHKLMVLKQYYGKYIEPSFKALNIDPPGFNRWAQGQHAPSYDQNTNPTETAGNSFWEGLYSGTTDTMRIGANLLHHKIPWAPDVTNQINARAADFIQKHIDGRDRVDQSYHTVFQTNHSKKAFLANLGGHVIGEAPAYLAVDAATGGLGASEQVLTSLGRAGKVAKLVKEGGEIYGIDRAEGRDNSTAVNDAIAGPLMGMGLHYGAKSIGYALGKSRGEVLGAMAKKGTDLAVSGVPFVHSVESHTDINFDPNNNRLGEGTKELPFPQSDVKSDNSVLKDSVQNEQKLREQIARKYYPQKAEAAGDKSIWRNLSSAQKTKVKEHIKGLTQAASEYMPLVNPEVQSLANRNLLEKADVRPDQQEFTRAVQEITGMHPADALTAIQAEDAAFELNIGTPAQNLDIAYNNHPDAGEYEPGEGASASLKPGYTVDYKRANNNVTPKNLVSADADNFIHGTIKYLPKSPATKSGKIFFEHPEHHLLWIANNSKAPDSIKRKAMVHLATEFGHGESRINNRAGWLKEHVNDLQRTGKVQDEGNVYRTTRLSPRRFGTKWQTELYTNDTAASQYEEIKSLLEANPELKSSVIPVLEELTKQKNKSATPGKLAFRSEAIEKYIELLKGIK